MNVDFDKSHIQPEKIQEIQQLLFPNTLSTRVVEKEKQDELSPHNDAHDE